MVARMVSAPMDVFGGAAGKLVELIGRKYRGRALLTSRPKVNYKIITSR